MVVSTIYNIYNIYNIQYTIIITDVDHPSRSDWMVEVWGADGILQAEKSCAAPAIVRWWYYMYILYDIQLHNQPTLISVDCHLQPVAVQCNKLPCNATYCNLYFTSKQHPFWVASQCKLPATKLLISELHIDHYPLHSSLSYVVH